MPTELTTLSDREVRLATAIKALSQREAEAYKYFVDKDQSTVAEEKADEMFALYQRGTGCEEIRSLFKVFSLGQVVACRVMYDWDARKRALVQDLEKMVPEQTATTQLEVQEFLSNLLRASTKHMNDTLKLFIATGDPKLLGVIPMPKTVKELAALVELHMKLSGTDVKRVEVAVQGGVTHTHQQQQVGAKEAEDIMDGLLGGRKRKVIDVIPDPPVPPPPMPAPAPKTPEEMIERLVGGGMPRARAEGLVAAMKVTSGDDGA